MNSHIFYADIGLSYYYINLKKLLQKITILIIPKYASFL